VLSDPEPWERYEEDEYEDEGPRGGWFESGEDVAPVTNQVYRAECGACHFAYQPGLLPAHAWERILGSLADHYGEDATLDATLTGDIGGYLSANAADRSRVSRSRAFDSLEDGAGKPPRITDTRYFRHEHHEIPRRLVASNDDVASFSNCQACHRGADAGIYNEHQVVIPGLGRWDD
jgi:hypothetical protein